MASVKDLLFGGGLQGAFDTNQAARQQYGQIGQDAAQRLAAIGRGEVQQGINQNLLNSYQNPALEQAIRTSQLAAQRRFAEQVAPGIEQQFAGLGTLGSGRSAVATGIAQRGLEENLADIESKARLNAYDKAYSAAVNAGANEFQARQSANQYLAGLGSQNVQGEVPSNLATLMGLIGPENIRQGLGGIYDYIFGGVPKGNQPPGGGAEGGIRIPGIGKIGIPDLGKIIGKGGPVLPPDYKGPPEQDQGEWNLPPPPGSIGPGDGTGSEDYGYYGGPGVPLPPPPQTQPGVPELPIYGGGSEDYGYYGGPDVPITQPGVPEDFGYGYIPPDFIGDIYRDSDFPSITPELDLPADNFDLFGQDNWWNQPILPTPPDSTEFWPVDSNNNWNFDIDWSLPDFNWDFNGWFDFDLGNWF